MIHFIIAALLILPVFAQAADDGGEGDRIREMQRQYFERKQQPRHPSAHAESWACGSIAAARLNGGNGYTNGTRLVELAGGSGVGAIAHFDAAGGSVVSVSWERTGSGYKAGDVLSIPGGNATLEVVNTYDIPLGKDGLPFPKKKGTIFDTSCPPPEAKP